MNTENKQYPKILNHLPALTNQIKRIAVEAGDIIQNHFDEGGFDDVTNKSDGSPVTIADKEAEIFIIKELERLTPNVPIVGEEKIADGIKVDLSDTKYYWLVDALDGTKAFISGDGDFTVNIALIHNEDPVLGVIYSPYHGELYAGSVGADATRWLEESENEKNIRTRSMPRDGLVVMASHNRSPEKRDRFLEDLKVRKIVRRYSSIKICMVAAARADIYPCLGETCYWDIAAGDAILRSAGGCICDLDGNKFKYKTDTSDYLNKEFIALSGDLYTALFDPN